MCMFYNFSYTSALPQRLYMIIFPNNECIPLSIKKQTGNTNDIGFKIGKLGEKLIELGKEVT